MDLGLKDRVYVVTGATRGLGNAAARELVADGAKVIVTGRDEKSAADAASALSPDAVAAVGVAADNADPGAAARLVETARERFGRFDGVLISVGGPPPGFVADNTDEQWQAAFESVFLGAVRLARTAAAELEDGGVIGFVLSGSVYEPIPGLTISNGLRPGLAGFAKSLADELGPRGIRVVGLLPGRIDTDRVRELDALSADPEATRAASESRIPLRRYGTPEEFGRTAAFLLSPAASYVTGVMLPVDGGGRHGF
ncbi:SDR family oxidoreductase [Streptomyces sp. SID5910]|uniref:SDR family oxidoreductase n=1 Tax=Streptomyces sp. SID5910 TaxID=2690312 RepID=UPI0013711E48|nr:SDR family oxidoreductase [Streptomyces sp. SID5910]MYR42217.1 SDR family oxidoreductase [Streptomyces sp. SID5910]